jgi:hypothetical protein
MPEKLTICLYFNIFGSLIKLQFKSICCFVKLKMFNYVLVDPEYQRLLQQQSGSYKSPSMLAQRGSPISVPMTSFSWSAGSYLPVSMLIKL